MNPKVIEYLNDGRVVVVEFPDKRVYKLQHPGNRKKLEWEKDYFNPATGIDRAKFLDYCFDNCVIAENGAEPPTVDEVNPKELEVWQRLLRRFLDGDLEPPVSRGLKRTVTERNKQAAS